MASERCAEQNEAWDIIVRGKLLGTMGSPFIAKEFISQECQKVSCITRGGQCREVLAKRSGNTEFIPSSYLNRKSGIFLLIGKSFISRKYALQIQNKHMEEKKMENKKFYMTTAIAYTSGKPHIGNTYEFVLADAIARYKRSQGYDVWFQTGTDEHGQKIELKAQEAGKSPKEFVDEIAAQVKDIADMMNTSYDYFIRTTDDYHEKQVQKMFKKMK